MLNRLILCSALAFFSAIPASAQNYPSLVLVHGHIWTENPTQPEAEAIALDGNHVLQVGTSADILRLAGPSTQVIELNGRRVVPGFNDAHVHFIAGGEALASVQLRDAASQAEFRERVAAFAKTQPDGAWITNGEWDHERWKPAVLPTHQLIDDVTAHNPVFIERLDGHMGLANAVAMKLAGVDRNTPDVPGGVIVRDADGNPTGIFKDAATTLIYRAIPPLSLAQTETAILAAQHEAARNGVTSVQEMANDTNDTSGPDHLRALQSLERGGRLNVRMSVNLRLLDWRNLANTGIQAGFSDGLVQVGGLKAFADGSLGSTTAWLLAPFDDQPANSGLASDELQHADQMYADIKGADQAGLQIAIHAIGDRANRTILDLYQRVEQEDGPRDRRLRIEHAQHLTAQDIPRFGQLHVIASMQPYHAIDDGRWAQKRLGPERIHFAYDFRSLLDSGATLAFGSDWPVAPMVPLMGIYAAVTRRTLDNLNPNGWIPEQKITVAEAVHAYTVGAAYAQFDEKVKGSLEPGKLADLVVLSRDIFHIDPVEIQNTRVDLTIFNGRVIYNASEPEHK
ncbi:amidohydrolase [Edaphobacter bradus]|uniref:amidohydrolase n=1 Tax=Edaphobacter bradus TaxID=2259016 RepID=UPI0021DFC691|nr:amidohydrolase [Edaphobacter bradus]